MNKFWRTAIPQIVNIIRKKPASVTIGDAPPSESQILQGGAEALLEDVVMQPTEYPDFNIKPTHGEPRT